MDFARFFRKYPVSLQELLLVPLIVREGSPLLRDLPLVTAAGMRDVATFAGHRDGAIRTAMSRLRSGGHIEAVEDGGVTRFRLGPMARSISVAVRDRFRRPRGYLLAIFSFASEDARERQLVRDVLKLHGFQKLAQNVYINGQIDTAEVERIVHESGLADHVFLFRCSDEPDERLERRLMGLFSIKRRAAVLARFERDLDALLNESGLPAETFARRYLAAAPVHYRITYVEEPPLPARCLPRDYPLERLAAYDKLTAKQARALASYYRRVATAAQPTERAS